MWLRRKIGHMIVSKTRVVFEPFNMKILVTAKPSRLENSTRAESFRVKKRITLFPVFRMSKQTKVRYVILIYITMLHKTNVSRLTFYIKATFLKNPS